MVLLTQKFINYRHILSFTNMCLPILRKYRLLPAQKASKETLLLHFARGRPLRHAFFSFFKAHHRSDEGARMGVKRRKGSEFFTSGSFYFLFMHLLQ